MVRYGILMNVHQCIGCKTCMVSCKDTYEIPAGGMNNYQGREYYRVWPVDKEMGKFPYAIRNETIMRCMQCQNPPCVAACPVPGALTQRKDGIVVVDSTKCIGDLACVAACPYGAMYYRADTMTADKCDLCASKLDAGLAAPVCVSACLGEAMVFGNLDDPNSTISQMVAQTSATPLHPEYGTNPSVYFVAHAAVLHAQVLDDSGNTIISGTPALLDSTTHTTSTSFIDSNGEFVFRNLKVGRTYSLTITGSGFRNYFQPLVNVTSEYTDLGTVTVRATS